jgi:dsDNA-binding SOS-regulon protein
MMADEAQNFHVRGKRNVFASKKEATLTKLLEWQTRSPWLLQSGMQSETQADLGLIAEQKETVQHILRTCKLPDRQLQL